MKTHLDEDLPLVMGYSELPQWLHDQEEISGSEFRRFSRQPVREILALYDDIRGHIVPLQEQEIPPDVHPGTKAVLQEVLTTFDPADGLLAHPTIENFDAFYDHAWKFCQRCDSCFVEYSHLLLPVYSDLVLALHTGRDGIRKEVGILAPAVTEFRLLNGRIAKIRQLFAAIQRIDAETRISMATETRASANLHTHQEQLAIAEATLATLESDPKAYAAQAYLDLVKLKNERARLRTIYDKLALILAGLTRRAWNAAQKSADHEAERVLGRLVGILETGDVPDGDELLSALINGYPVLLEMVESGEIAVEDEMEQYLFMDAGAFNNGMRNVCKDYRAACEKYDRSASAMENIDVEGKKNELRGEMRELETLVRSETAIRDDAIAVQETTAMHRQAMARMIEEGLLEMTGRNVRLRLNWPPTEEDSG
ncbi:MAG: hypothetical protein GYA23_02960 [Methanomicrobiales archaeon]|nr:hypothetical protein [Methanomicrobiales archaeon]